MNAERMIHLITHLTAIIILASYSAALVSFLTVETVHLPFSTMQGLIDDNTYKMGVFAGSADYYLLKVIKYAEVFDDIIVYQLIV